MTEALGFLDMKQICYCLAHCILKHIDFGQGFLFLQDLKDFKSGAQVKDLDFSYNLGALKIDVEQAKKAKTDKDKQAFESLKKQMEEKSTPLQDTTKGLAVEKQQSAGSIEEDVKSDHSSGIEDFYEDDPKSDLDYSQTHLDDFLKS